jgi:hypothetical protein
LRFAVSILGSEVLALEFGAVRPDEGSLRYDPSSTTACQTETVFADQNVVLCESPFGFTGGAGPSLP